MSHKNISSTSISFDSIAMWKKNLNKSIGIYSVSFFHWFLLFVFFSILESYLILKLHNEMWDNFFTRRKIDTEKLWKYIPNCFIIALHNVFPAFFSLFFSSVEKNSKSFRILNNRQPRSTTRIPKKKSTPSIPLPNLLLDIIGTISCLSICEHNCLNRVSML